MAHQRLSVYLLHITNVVINLVKPWKNTWHTVCADSYFASVPTVNEIEKIGSHFFALVKTDTKKILCKS